jgi:flagellar motor switch protein FliM
MADESLSPAELETLLSRKASAPAAGVGQGSARQLQPGNREPRLPPLPSLNVELKQVLVARHERCAAQFAGDLAALVRRPAEVSLVSVAPTSYREFVARLDNPTCLNLLSHSIPGPPWLLEIAPPILFPIIACMLGGGHSADAIAGRPMTDIELRLAGRVSSACLARLRQAWSDALDLKDSIERVESRPNRAAAMKSDEPLVWSRFELAIGRSRGALNLAIPFALLVAIEPQLTGRRHGTRDSEPPPPDPTSARVELVARLAQSKIPALDAAALRVGDVIATDERVGAAIPVLQDGEVKFSARVGVVGGRKAVEIEDVVVRADDAGPTDR